MNTPIWDFVRKYADSDATRLHMPGHKGKGVLLDFEKYDITEIYGADSLFDATGVIKESEKNLSALFDTGASFYSCEGSSLCVRAMLYLARLNTGESRGYILASRNAHRSLISASALLDFDIEWLYQPSEDSYLKCEITPEALQKRLGECAKKPFCVYVTSPDYLGNIADIKGLARVCEENGTLLVVDNAHGAYLRFLESDMHPITLGAHMCCDSAHKTLPALTGGAYLHISKKAPTELASCAKDALALFATTSPSYLILSSLDKVNEYLDTSYKERLASFIARLSALKARLATYGYEIMDTEPLKIVIRATSYGYTGEELGAEIEKHGLVWEMRDKDFLVLMLTPENDENDLNKIERAFSKIERRAKITHPVLDFTPPKRAMSIREAVMSRKETLPIKEARGRACARICTFCPPAVSLVVAGEIINDSIIDALEFYGFDTIEVCK